MLSLNSKLFLLSPSHFFFFSVSGKMDSFQVNLQSNFCWPLFLLLFPIKPAKQKYTPLQHTNFLCACKDPPSRWSREHKKRRQVVVFLKSSLAACNVGAQLWCLSYKYPCKLGDLGSSSWSSPQEGCSNTCPKSFSHVCFPCGVPCKDEVKPIAGTHQWS